MTPHQTGFLVSRTLSVVAFITFIASFGKTWMAVAMTFGPLGDSPFVDRLVYVGLMGELIVLGVVSVVCWQQADWIAMLLTGGSNSDQPANAPSARIWFRFVGLVLALWSLPGIVEFLYSAKYEPNALDTPGLITSIIQLAIGVVMLRPFDIVRGGFFEDPPAQ